MELLEQKKEQVDSLQEELESIEQIIQKYTLLAQSAQSQMEMNISSRWFFVIWDTELNSLWSRFSNSADPQTKGSYLICKAVQYAAVPLFHSAQIYLK